MSSRFIQHHYDDAQHQFDAGKLGMWLFLAQEILFFSALFVAYVVYRANHPEIFAYAHRYLDTTLGAINTAVLIFSSLTAAWAVRAAQLQQRRIMVAMLSVTIACACAFLAIKYVEYSHKADIGALFGARFRPSESPDGTRFEKVKNAKGEMVVPAAANSASDAVQPELLPPDAFASPAGADDVSAASGPLVVRAGATGAKNSLHAQPPPPNTAMFFTIYFAMTGLHAIHVLVGIGVFVWLLVRALKGHFTPDYYGPIDYAALYWHLVDLIWIYLFPLLYLIH